MATIVTRASKGTTLSWAEMDANLTNLNNKVIEVISVKDYGAVGDGVTNDTSAFTSFITYLNSNGGIGFLPKGNYLINAGTINLTRAGIQLIGEGKGNCANMVPATAAPTTITITGTGVGIRVREQSITLKDFRLTSDTTRAALTFDITQAGIRIEPDDTSTARADRCKVQDVRVDNQPGDGILTVGAVTYTTIQAVDVYECKGNGFRFDAGNHASLTRTNTHYPGLITMSQTRAGFCGGHSFAFSNPSAIVQNHMAIRCTIYDHDSFGNGITTANMYASGDGKFYDFWIFGENCEITKSGCCGYQGYSLTPEILGGIWIAGRDNKLTNNRYVSTSQPIYWGYVAAQPSTGLEVNQMRVINTTLTHTDCIKYQSGSAQGLRVYYDRIEYFTNVATYNLSGPLTQSIFYRGEQRHVQSIFTTGTNLTIADDSVVRFKFTGQTSVLAQGVLTIACSSITAGGGIFHIRAAASSPLATKWAGETNTVGKAGGGALTGTTGVDGQLTVSCDSDSFYIENRLGFLIALNLHLAATPMETGLVQV